MLPIVAGEHVGQTLQAGHCIHVYNLSYMGRLGEIPFFPQGPSAVKGQSIDFNHWVSSPSDHVHLTLDTASGKVQANWCQLSPGGKGASTNERKWTAGERVAGSSVKCSCRRAYTLSKDLQIPYFRQL